MWSNKKKLLIPITNFNCLILHNSDCFYIFNEKKKDTVERNKRKKKSNTFLRDHKTIMKFFNMQKKTEINNTTLTE